MASKATPTAKADVFAHNAGTKNAYVQVLNLDNETKTAAALAVARGLADYVMEQVGTRLEVTPSSSGNSIKVSGRFSSDPKDYDSQGAVAASMVIGLVKFHVMGDVEGYNALKRLQSQELIGIDQVANGLKEIGFRPETLPDGARAAPHEARGRAPATTSRER